MDEVVEGDVQILLTIPYHVRSAAGCAARYGGTIWGHRGCLRWLSKSDPFQELTPDSPPAGVRPIAIGNPRRREAPLLIESCGALCFGDVLVGVPGSEGPLRIWFYSDYSEGWYRRRFLPSLEPLKELDVRSVLVTHGEPVLKDARAALRHALERDPWYHRAG